MVEEDLQHLEKELAAAQVSIHPQKVMQVAKGVFPEEEEAEEEKSDVIDVIILDTELMNVHRMWGQIKEM